MVNVDLHFSAILLELPTVKFHENPPSGSPVMRKTDRRGRF
jgi:hypothetical protein